MAISYRYGEHSVPVDLSLCTLAHGTFLRNKGLYIYGRHAFVTGNLMCDKAANQDATDKKIVMRSSFNQLQELFLCHWSDSMANTTPCALRTHLL